MKKHIAAFLTVVLLLTLASAAYAAPATFPDIKDATLAREVAVLQMLGAVGGNESGQFVPDGTLTRAAFCKMAVITMGRGEEEPLYRNRTIFHDVRSTHWARGYINIAVSGENKIIAGSGGYFMPDENITYAQAVTILMRMLGYTDADAGMMWPDGYMTLAYDKGLTEGMAAVSWTAPITRAQAAHLFYRMLGTTKKGGGSYIGSLGTASDNVVIMELGVRASDGTGNAVRTSQGIVKTVSGVVPPSILGLRGTLVKNASGKALTFLPDKNMTTVTASGIDAAWIKDDDGVRFDIDPEVLAYTTSEDNKYGDMFMNIAVGARVTFFYSPDGKIDGVYINTSKADGAVVAGMNGTISSFSWLTGGDTGYSVLKNGAPATLSDIRQYDVITYDKSARVLNVTDFRLTGCYESCWPNLTSPSKVTVMGHEFPVLSTAIESMAQYKLGQVVTLLLTADGQVAGTASGISGSAAVGIVKTDITASKATVTLLNGLVLTGNPRLTDSTAASYAGELVAVSSYATGQISLSKFNSTGASGELDLTKLTVGTAALSPAVKILERVGTGAVTQISLSGLTQSKVSASKILYAHTDYAGRVDLLMLNDVTGDRYEYGLLNEKIETANDSVFGDYSNRYISIINSNHVTGTTPIMTGAAFSNGAPGGIAVSADGTKLEAVVTLTEVKNVSRAAFYTVGGKTYLHLPTMDIMVSDNVECFNKLNKTWFDTLNSARAFADTLTVYYDRAPSEGGKIRMIVVG
jgi:hypothetical protein